MPAFFWVKPLPMPHTLHVLSLLRSVGRSIGRSAWRSVLTVLLLATASIGPARGATQLLSNASFDSYTPASTCTLSTSLLTLLSNCPGSVVWSGGADLARSGAVGGVAADSGTALVSLAGTDQLQQGFTVSAAGVLTLSWKDRGKPVSCLLLICTADGDQQYVVTLRTSGGSIVRTIGTYTTSSYDSAWRSRSASVTGLSTGSYTLVFAGTQGGLLGIGAQTGLIDTASLLLDTQTITSYGLQTSVTGGDACNVATLTVTARDQTGATMTGYTGTVKLSTSTSAGDWSAGSSPAPTGTLSNGTANDGAATYTFKATDQGVAVLRLTQPQGTSLTVTAVDSSVAATSTTSGSISTRCLHHLELRAASATGVTCAPTTLTVAACSDATCATAYTGGVTGALGATGGTVVWPATNAFTIAAGSPSTTVAAQLVTPGSTLFSTALSVPTATNATTKSAAKRMPVRLDSRASLTVGDAGAPSSSGISHHPLPFVLFSFLVPSICPRKEQQTCGKVHAPAGPWGSWGPRRSRLWCMCVCTCVCTSLSLCYFVDLV